MRVFRIAVQVGPPRDFETGRLCEANQAVFRYIAVFGDGILRLGIRPTMIDDAKDVRVKLKAGAGRTRSSSCSTMKTTTLQSSGYRPQRACPRPGSATPRRSPSASR